ncbi:ribosome biogenesis factor YjgA [Endozoicomonadaceae bacterium StTr2]
MSDIPHDDVFDDDEEEIIYVSKSELKRDAQELRDLGVRLAELKPSQLDKLPLHDRLRQAVDESHRIKSHNARKRHFNFIGKLMQDQDVEPIKAMFEQRDGNSAEYNRRFHALESWRERLINDGNAALGEYIAAYPDVDMQHLRQLIRNAAKEVKLNKGPTHQRKLFRYLREVDGL